MKKMKKIMAAAIAMMTFSTAAAVTGTVAWFTANNLVNVTGMTVTTQVDGNLFIAGDNTSDDSYLATDTFEQVVSGKVEPVSTVNGVNWFYTKDEVKGTGAASATSVFHEYSSSAAPTDSTTYDNAFDEYYGIAHVVPYVDYAFYLKATASSASQKVSLTKVNLLYNNVALTGNDKAWRVAVYSQEVAQNTNSSTDGTNRSILKLSDAAYFTTNKAVSAINGSGIASYDTVSNLNSEAVIGTIATAGATQRYKVVVRIFLEGEDTKCNNETYVTLTNNYTLDLTCKLGDSGVVALGSQA